MKIDKITEAYNKVDEILDNLHDENKNFIFFSYRNSNQVIAIKNNHKIEDITRNGNYTYLTIYIRNINSIDDIDFNFYDFQSNQYKIIIKLIFIQNDSICLDFFINFLQDNNFINFINTVIETYNHFIKLLPKNMMIADKVNKLKANGLAKKQNKKIIITNNIQDMSKYKKDILLFQINSRLTLSSIQRYLQFLRKKMKKVWSISTTVRNPERLRNFLITLKELEHHEWTKETQIEFQIRLIKNRFYGFSNAQFYNGLTQKQIDLIDDIKNSISLEQATEILRAKNYVDADMRGRNSYKPLEKMGLASIIDAKIKITSLGEYLLSDDYDLGDMFFKSFLKWQYPNPVDRDFKNSQIYNLKPFILTLHLINEVNNICKLKEIKVKGISRLEFEIFGQTLLNYTDLKTQASSLVNFRLELEKVRGHKEKKDFTENYIDEFLSDFTNIDYNNLRDYADNTIRYFRLTRFIYIRGGGYYIDLEPRRMIEINNLLNTYNGSSETFTKEEYIQYISDINLPILPWEEKDKLIEIYTDLINDITNLQEQLNQEVITFKTLDNVDSIKSEIKILRQYRHKLQNIILKQDLADISKIDEVIESLVDIRNLDLKPSIALEKYITMALNIINDANDIKANSLVGDDNEFIFTAPANKPDIECYYDNFNSICEVTMLNGRDQWHNEGQPVMRHFRDFENDSSLNDNYCLFVAPKLHRDTINTFWFSVKYEYEGDKQKIVPFTITQIIEILQVIKELKENDKSFSHLQFQKLLDNIIDLKDNVNNSDDWLRAIPNTILNFKEEVLCS